MKLEIAPSILSADFSRLGEEIKAVEPHASRIHVDVMDGHFVPNLTMGPVIVQSIRPLTQLPIEVHLMVTDPALFTGPFIQAGADRIVFHVETVTDPLAMCRLINTAGASAGVALNPETDWVEGADWLEAADLALIMTVRPGFGGQAFLHGMLGKVQAARTDAPPSTDVEVDGGIDSATALLARDAGANIFVAGHSIFKTVDPGNAAKSLRIAIQEGAR